MDAPSAAGIEQEQRSCTYKTGDRQPCCAGPRAGSKDGTVYIDLYDVQLAGVQKRQAQLGIVSSGFKVLAQRGIDLSQRTAADDHDRHYRVLEALPTATWPAFGIPGAAVGIVQDGRLIYAQGFGDANPKPARR